AQYRIREVLSEVVELMQRNQPGHRIILRAGQDKVLFGDRQRTAQVLNNLLSNAVKYTPKGKRIVVSSTLLQSAVQVCVSDQGSGIPKGLETKIFQRFF